MLGVMDADEDGLRSDLVDLNGLDFDDLSALPDSVFAAALARLDRNNDELAGQYSGFQSVLDVKD